MKYNKNKIKREHNILKEFEKFVQKLATYKEIDRLIPWRISRSQWSSSREAVSFSYFTESGSKLLMKKWWTVQELFLIHAETKNQAVACILHDMWVEKLWI